MRVEAAPSRASSAFFDEFRGAWSEAARSVGTETRSYRVAGLGLELRFAGDALVAPLTRALAHLAPGEPALDSLVVHAWESETTGIPVPRPPWDTDDYREYGTIRGYFDERIQSVFQWGSRSFVMLDLDRSEALYWVGSAGQIPYFEMAAPLRLVLHGWLASRDVELVHAGAIGSDAGCVLVVGKTGSGKSWTTLSSIAAGLRLVADDYCLIHGGVCPRVASVFSSAKTHEDALSRLPFLREMVANPDRPDYDKAVYFLNEHVPERLLLEAELRAILVPRLGGDRETRVRPANAAAALAALAPSTILQLPAADSRTLQRLADIAKSVPSYHLELGTELETTPRAIASLLETEL